MDTREQEANTSENSFDAVRDALFQYLDAESENYVKDLNMIETELTYGIQTQ